MTQGSTHAIRASQKTGLDAYLVRDRGAKAGQTDSQTCIRRLVYNGCIGQTYSVQSACDKYSDSASFAFSQLHMRKLAQSAVCVQERSPRVEFAHAKQVAHIY